MIDRAEACMAVQVEIDGGITVILLDRPRKAHAYDQELLHQLDAALLDVTTSLVVLGSTGNGAFCGGADLEEMKGATAGDALEMESQALFERLATAPYVSIAAVQGAAAGGGFELALACDLRVAGPNARFFLPETSLGLIPSAGGCTRLPHVVGRGRAKEMILGGREIDAQAALAWGVVSRVSENPLEEARQWAHSLAVRDREALSLAKEILDADGDRASRLEMERFAEAGLYERKRGNLQGE
jgi:enoyl-CoA hydratase/carnithine racemase